jgi:hypothetical protein
LLGGNSLSKEKAYKALYNPNQIKIKEKKMKDASMQGEILEFQDKLLAAHFPAVSATNQCKQPHEDSDTCGGSLLGGSTLTTPTGTWTSTSSNSVLGRQASLKESLKSKELAT